MTQRIRFIHWNVEEGRERALRLRAAGYRVAFEIPKTQEAWKRVRKDVPDAYVIDLDRLPSHGREAALFFRQTKTTRQVPQVFVGGEAEKVKRLRQLLPDAVYTSWRGIRGALARAIHEPPQHPIVPAGSVMAGYSGTPLPKKLGIKPGVEVALVDAPADFARTLGSLPEGAKLRRWTLSTASGRSAAQSRHGLAMWFVRRRAVLERSMSRMAELAATNPIWIASPKKASRLASDFSQTDVRRVGLAAGLVDYKVCAIDETWSGLLFAKRKT